MYLRITTPSRLHFGLIDFNGNLGRIDGGSGVAINNPRNVISIKPGKKFHVNCQSGMDSSPKSVEKIARDICNKLGKPLPDFEVTVEEEIPAHAGFGSKTQMSLALAYAISKEYDMPYNGVEGLARLVDRGGTSGIGVRAFDKGGFILDCGHSFGAGKEKDSCLPSSASKAKPGPLVMRSDIPEDWRFVLVMPLNDEGSHGQSEVDIFQKSFPLDEVEIGRVCRVILMQMVPGILEKDIETFGSAINNIQEIGFKNIEVKLKSPLVPNMLSIMNHAGSYGSGMSSFGPTVYGLTNSNKKAEEIRNAVSAYLDDMSIEHKCWIAEPNNQGMWAKKIVAEHRIISPIPVPEEEQA
jgi:beta-ribofuranosylaminobenzene 5'-phosphate synthase